MLQTSGGLLLGRLLFTGHPYLLEQVGTAPGRTRRFSATGLDAAVRFDPGWNWPAHAASGCSCGTPVRRDRLTVWRGRSKMAYERNYRSFPQAKFARLS